jgi:hypothetical protein
VAVHISLCDLAQAHCDDVVLAASTFKPNAAGRAELTGWRAFSDRQLLKGRGAYLGERVLVAVTTVEVVAIAHTPISFGRRRLAWKRQDLVARAVAPKTQGCEVPLPAFVLAGRGRTPHIELAALADDEPTASVLGHLFTASDYERLWPTD